MPLSFVASAASTPDLSVVVPLKDEAGNSEPLASETEEALAGARLEWECISVEDGSIDGSLEARS